MAVKKNKCKKYEGWGCFLSLLVMGIVGVGLLIGFGGPWYHDCDVKDCSYPIYYGIYCDDYCWYGNYGPGNGLLFVIFALLVLVFAFPWCWPHTGRVPRKIYRDGHTYELVSDKT